MNDAAQGGLRKPRSDSLRNREQLLASAKSAFTERGANVALEDIARAAGVGIGTLYRHFANREALLAAVYSREVEQLAAAADALLARLPPGEALEAWLHQLVDYMATKRVIAPALQAAPSAGSALNAAGPAVGAALSRLTDAAIAAGDIRADLEPEDLIRLLGGLSLGHDRPGWAASARRLIGVVMAGLRPAAR
jgi:AcrR family transcriptional regulator